MSVSLFLKSIPRRTRRSGSPGVIQEEWSFGSRIAARSDVSAGGFIKECAAMHTCPKCSGFLVPAPSPLHLLSDYFVDTYDLQDKQSVAVSCLNCGYFADAVTLRNKAKQADAQRLVAQAEGWAETHSVTISTMEGFYHASTDTRRTDHDTHSAYSPANTTPDGSQTELFTEPCRTDLFRE